MASRRKPVDDARKRVEEKLGAIDEQVNFIHNCVSQITCEVQGTAQQLLKETNKSKFLAKYRNVSQDLEKCLADLLVISAAVASLDDDEDIDDDEEEEEEEEEEKEEANNNEAIVKIEPKSPTLEYEEKSPLPKFEGAASRMQAEDATSPNDSQHSVVNEEVIVDGLKREETKAGSSSEEVTTENVFGGHHGLFDKNTGFFDKNLVDDVFLAKQSGVGKMAAEQPQNLVSKRDKTRSKEGGSCPEEQRKLSVVSDNDKTPPGKRETSSPTEIFAGDLLEKALSENSSPTKRVLALPIPSFKFPDKGFVQVTVSEIKSPSEFWIQQVTDDLDSLLEEMCVFFLKCAKNGDKGGMGTLPVVGDACCGKFSGDHMWYRACVTEVFPGKGEAEVIFVDEGNRECLPPSKLRPLHERFRKLPCQAMCCKLTGIELIPEKNGNATDWFKRRLSGETLLAVPDEDYNCAPPGSPAAIRLYIRPCGTMNVESIDALQQEYSVNNMMLREGFATSTEVHLADNCSVSLDSGVQSARTSRAPSCSSTASACGSSPTKSKTRPCDMESACDKSLGGNNMVSRGGCLGDDDVCVPAPVIPLDADGSAYLLVSHVVNPGEFYVNFATVDCGQLDTMMTRMNVLYKGGTVQSLSSPRIGDFCCARFSVDGDWYRAVVLQVRHVTSYDTSGLTEVVMVEVFYVDFGNTERVVVGDLRYLLPEFRQLPIQAVKCSLANIRPVCSGEEVDAGAKTEEDRVISRAGGDEEYEEGEEVDLDMAKFSRTLLVCEGKQGNRSPVHKKNHPQPSVVSDTAAELFDKVWSAGNAAESRWSGEAVECFRTLADSSAKMIGFVEPWDSRMLNSIVGYEKKTECNLPNLGPALKLNLYDVSNEHDVFINATLVTAGHAVYAVRGTRTNEGHSVVPVVKMNQQSLANIAKTLPEPVQSDDNPRSPTDTLMDNWDPMNKDYESFRNAYNVKTDDVHVAITGYEEDRGQICQFFNTKYGCFKGDKCPYVHADQDLKDKICINGFDQSMCLSPPEIGMWVAARITAMYNPNHFWVQLPFGKEPLDKQLLKKRSGLVTSGEENIKELEEQRKSMRTMFGDVHSDRQRSIVPPEVGELVIVRHEVDKEYYRSLVKQEKDGRYEVLFLDYGFSTWIGHTALFPMIPQFLHLPFQAIECYLPNIRPASGADGSSLWSKEEKSHFESIVSNKLVVCYILSTAVDNTMSVNLYDSTNGMNLSSEMVKSSFAKYRSNISSQANKSSVYLEYPG